MANSQGVRTGVKLAIGVSAFLLGTLSIVLISIYVGRFGTFGAKGVEWDPSSPATITKLISWHFVLMVVAVVVSSAGVLSFAILPGSRPVRKAIHSALNAVALVFFITGWAAATRWHDKVGRPDYYSIHSWIGLIGIIFFMLQWAVGFGSFALPIAPLSFRATVINPHILFGSLAYLIPVAALVTGVQHMQDVLLNPPFPTIPPIGFFGRAVLIFGFLNLSIIALASLVIYSHSLIRPIRHIAEKEEAEFVKPLDNSRLNAGGNL
eukprot:TRINITY_DN13856_c0_g2_i1.p1 TRINITY_DN13856_c0_g2~~TRINITY_DN13856_c0_g2_i1.p1  ORF type:complete len:274 (-),score=34.81 TRINITY_DN13856_c0_g2_i1:717-1511(-)